MINSLKALHCSPIWTNDTVQVKLQLMPCGRPCLAPSNLHPSVVYIPFYVSAREQNRLAAGIAYLIDKPFAESDLYIVRSNARVRVFDG